jgi:predicted lipoprotein with Yx(FWY)xxD motif
MHRTRTIVVSSLVAASLVLAGCGSDDDDSSSTSTTTESDASAARPVLKAADNATLGRIVVDAQGRTVYTLTDAGGAAVVCEGSCLAAWPPVLIGAGASATGGAGVRDVSSVEGAEGEQATINGLPLYTYAGDAAPGDARGDGINSFGGTWKVVKVSGAGAAAGSSGTSSTTSGATTTTSDDSYDDGY